VRTRLLVGAIGAGMALWGAWLALGVPQIFEVGAWFVAGPILHDALLAPIVAVLGLAFKGPAKVGAVISGVLILIAIPLLWQENVPTNPGLHDANYLAGLAITLGVVWLLVLGTAVVRRRLSRTSTNEG
jgi:hypothetical protein